MISTEPTLFDRIRSRCWWVASQAESVRIDEERLPAYARLLAAEPLHTLQMDPEIHFLGQGDATVAFFLTLDTINFGSGYFPDVLGDQSRSGYGVIAAALAARFRRSGPLSAAELETMTEENCFRIFPFDPSQPAARELMEFYTGAWRELGRFLRERFDGRFERLVAAAGGSCRNLVNLLLEMSSFRDEAHYREELVPFCKRAQIAAADLHIAFAGEGPGRFVDIGELTIFADNLVPHVLRCDGVLHYHPDLAARIDNGAPLPAGSPEEVEIRACSVHAAELLLAALQDQGRTVTALQLDNFLWHRGQAPIYRSRPRHRTRTIFY